MKASTLTCDEAARAEAREIEDYSIYPHMDGIRRSTSWRLGSYGDNGALTKAEIARLVDTFQLPVEIVSTLSQQLGYCLNNDDDIAINLTEVKRSQAIDRGQKALRKLLRQAKRGFLTGEELQANLVSLSSYFALTPEDKALLPAVLIKLETEVEITTGIFIALEQVLRTPGAAADMSPRDRRRSVDKRRQYIVETCCYAWKDADRPLTYTTYSDGRDVGQRHGPLIKFIQAAVMLITDPCQELSGETIRKDIDNFRDARAREGEGEGEEFRAPPEFGNQYT